MNLKIDKIKEYNIYNLFDLKFKETYSEFRCNRRYILEAVININTWPLAFKDFHFKNTQSNHDYQIKNGLGELNLFIDGFCRFSADYEKGLLRFYNNSNKDKNMQKIIDNFICGLI